MVAGGAATAEEEGDEDDDEDNKRARFDPCSQLTESISQWASDIYDNYGPPDFCAVNGLFGVAGRDVSTAWEESAEGTASMFAQGVDATEGDAQAEGPSAAAAAPEDPPLPYDTSGKP